MQHHWLFGFAILFAWGLPGSVGSLAFGQAGEDSPPVSAMTAERKSAPDEQLIYVPYAELREVFEKHGAAVFLPFQEYLSLWEKAWPQRGRAPEAPPVGGVISTAQYTAKVEKDLVRVQATYTVQVLKAGWVEIPVAFGEAAIGSVQGEPETVLLRGTGNGTYALLFSKPGEQKVTLELTARVRTAPEGRSFELQIPNVGITSFELTIPEADQSIELQPKLLQEVKGDTPQTTQLVARLGSTDRVTARWHPRVGTKPDMELLASATNATLISIEDGLIHADAYFQIEVLRGQLEQVQVAVPKGQRILDVTSAARLKEWTVAEEENRQIVTATFLSRQSGRIPLEIHTEWALTAEPFEAAGLSEEGARGIHLVNVLRESGQIALRAATDLVLNVTQQMGLARIDESEVDARIKRPGAAYFKFYSPQCRLMATAKPVEPRITVEQQADVVITSQQLRLQTQLQYLIERAGLFELSLKIPAGLTVETVQCDGLKQYDVSSDGAVLTISLRESRQGTLPVSVLLVRPRDPQASTEEFPIPLLEPVGAEVETGKVRILAPETLEVVTDPAGIVGFQPDPSPSNGSRGTNRLVSAWTFTRRPVALPARTSLRPTRLTAVVATTVDVQPGQQRVASLLTYQVEFAGLDTFRFEVPEAVSSTLQIELASGNVPPIREKSPGAAVEGWVPWTVKLQREATGAVRFRLTYDVAPATAADKSETATIAVVRALDPFVEVDGSPAQRSIKIARITGEVTVRKDRALSVATTATGGDVEAIDVRELAELPSDGFMAYRYFQQPVELGLKASKFEVQGVLETVASRGLVEVVLDRSGIALTRARYRLQSSERQRLRIDLPKGIEPLGAELDGRSIPLEKNPDAKPLDGWDAFYVNVARTKASDEAFYLTVQYRMTLAPSPFQTYGGKLQLRLPSVGGSNAAVPVQQLRVVLWSPEEFSFVGTPNHFEQYRNPVWRAAMFNQRPQTSVEEHQAWIGAATGGLFDFPTEGTPHVYTNLGGRVRIETQWWHLPFYTWIVSGALVVIAVILRNTSWENKLTLGIVGVFLASAYALSDADLIWNGLLVARYGLLALLALWVVHAMFRRGPRSRSSSKPPGTPPAAVIPPPGVFDMVTLGMQK